MQLQRILAEIAPTKGWVVATGSSEDLRLGKLFSTIFSDFSQIIQAQKILTMEQDRLHDRLSEICQSGGDPRWDVWPQWLYVEALRNIIEAALLVGWDSLPDLDEPPRPSSVIPAQSCGCLCDWSELVLREAKRERERSPIN